MKYKYIFNIIFATIFFAIASFLASKCNNEIIDVVIWLCLTAWNLVCLFLIQGIERNDTFDEIRKNQKEIIKQIESLHEINLNIRQGLD